MKFLIANNATILLDFVVQVINMKENAQIKKVMLPQLKEKHLESLVNFLAELLAQEYIRENAEKLNNKPNLNKK